MIQVQDLIFSYPKQRPLLKIEDFNISPGERVFMYGPSGSGKTTFLGIVSGLIVPDAGQVRVAGINVYEATKHERDRIRGAHIGYIFQQFNLIPYLSVRQNIELPCFLSDERKQRLEMDLSDKVLELAQHLSIEEVLNKSVAELSVGQQQRVAAARALIGRPEVIVADEPTSSLDTEHRADFIKLLFKEAELTGAAILFVSHDLSLASFFQRSVSLNEMNQARSV